MAAVQYLPGEVAPAAYPQQAPPLDPARVVRAKAVLRPVRIQPAEPGAQPDARPLVQAVPQLRPVSPISSKQHLVELLKDRPAELEKLVRMRFQQVATPKPSHDGESLLSLEEMENLAGALAHQIGVESSVFGEIAQMFWRFDFSGDGMLNEDETTRLTMCMLRKYRDSTQPPQPGVVRLGGTIAYRKVEDKYTLSRKLGEGGQGNVYLATEKTAQKQVAVKYYDKSNPNSPVEDITQEFELMMSLKHPRIAHYFEIFQDFANIYVVTEPYSGGDLSECITKAVEDGVRVDEPWLAKIMKQVLAGIAFLHSNDIMHCDIKEQNVMITGTDFHSPQVVVIDFGLANAFSAKSGPGGTPGYMPPEVWTAGLWLPRGDVFSLGVMLFALRTGRNPFQEGCLTLADIQKKTLQLQPDMYAKGTEDCQALVYSMINKVHTQRPTVADVMESRWFSSSEDPGLLGGMFCCVRRPEADLELSLEQKVDEGVLEKLASKQRASKFRKAVLADMASRHNLAEYRELNDLFVKLDKDNNGEISTKEVRTALENRWTPEHIDKLLLALGAHESKTVSYEEFMGHLLAAKAPEENKLLWSVFEDVGRGRSYLDLEDIRELLRRPAVAKILGRRDPEAVMIRMDKNRNGRVEFAEFKAVMQGGSPTPHAQYQLGDEIRYYSVTYASWLMCTVTAEDPKTGAVQVDIKPGFWFKGTDLTTKLRPVGSGPVCTKAGALGRQILDGTLNLFGQSKKEKRELR